MFLQKLLFFYCLFIVHFIYMEVYVEYAFIDNFLIDFVLLKTSVKCARVKSSLLKLILASFIASVIAILIPLLNLSKIFLFIVKILVGFLMALIAGSFINFKGYLLLVFFLFLFTFLSGGLIIALFNLASIDYTLYFSINYNFIVPVGVTFFLVYICGTLVCKLVVKLYEYRAIGSFYRKCEVIIKGKKIKVDGFIDSGNKLYDNVTGMVIIVASKTFIKKLCLENLLPNKYRQILIETVSGFNKMKVFNIDKLKIYNGAKVNIYNNVLMGEAITDFSLGETYQLLLHSDLY